MKLIRYFFCLSVAFVTISMALNLTHYKKYEILLYPSENTTNKAVRSDNEIVELPFSLKLDSLFTAKYKSGKAKMYSAEITLQYAGNAEKILTEVNSPGKFHQYRFYLQDIDKNAINLLITESLFAEMTHAAIFLMLISALAYIFFDLKTGIRKRSAMIVVLFGFAVLAIMFARNPMLRNSELPPILRSVWFLPHVAAYIISYALLFAGLAISIFASFKKNTNNCKLAQRVHIQGTMWYTVGLSLGMIWAQASWGTFWNWDPKETFALITWIFCLFSSFFFSTKKIGVKFNLLLQIIAVLLLIFCWIGPTLFRISSIHAY